MTGASSPHSLSGPWRERWQAFRQSGCAQPAAWMIGFALVLFWAYWPTFLLMGHLWATDPKYSQGFLVPIFALIVLWSRREHFAQVRFGLTAWGVWLILAGCLMRLATVALYYESLDAYSLVPILLGMCALLGGWAAVRWAWPSVLFLVFMMPIPFRLDVALAYPLQRLATVTSAYLMQTLGLPAIHEGNIIYVEEHTLGVIEACSGLGMLITFFALSTAVALLIARPWWERCIVFFSAIPIALISNILRITVTGVLYVTVGGEVANVVFHDLAGWLMMPLALLLLWLELKLLARLVVEVEVEEDGPIGLGLAPERTERDTPPPAPPVEAPLTAGARR